MRTVLLSFEKSMLFCDIVALQHTLTKRNLPWYRNMFHGQVHVIRYARQCNILTKWQRFDLTKHCGQDKKKYGNIRQLLHSILDGGFFFNYREQKVSFKTHLQQLWNNVLLPEFQTGNREVLRMWRQEISTLPVFRPQLPDPVSLTLPPGAPRKFKRTLVQRSTPTK